MNNFLKALILASITLGSGARADGVLTTSESGKIYQGVSVVNAATFTATTGKAQVFLAGLGVRKKPLVGAIYVAQLLVSDTSALDRSSAENFLVSLERMSAVAMQLNMKTGLVDGDKLNGAFSDALVANKVDTKSGHGKAILDFAKSAGAQSTGGKMNFIAEIQPSGKVIATLQATDASKIATIEGGRELINVLFGLWLGTLPASDSLLQALKADLVAGKNL